MPSLALQERWDVRQRLRCLVSFITWYSVTVHRNCLPPTAMAVPCHLLIMLLSLLTRSNCVNNVVGARQTIWVASSPWSTTKLSALDRFEYWVLLGFLFKLVPIGFWQRFDVKLSKSVINAMWWMWKSVFCQLVHTGFSILLWVVIALLCMYDYASIPIYIEQYTIDISMILYWMHSYVYIVTLCIVTYT